MDTQTSTLISAIAAGIQAVAVVFTLGFLWWNLQLVARQTQLARDSMLDLAKQTRLNSMLAADAQYRDLNDWALRDAKLLELMPGETKADIYAAFVLNTFSTRQMMHEEGIIDDDTWEADKRTLAAAFRWDFMSQHWEKPEAKRGYTPDFCRFIDIEILPQSISIAATDMPISAEAPLTH